MAGDSLVRHTYSALLMIVTGRVDPVVDAGTTSDCRGDHFFDDGKACRERIAFDTNADYHVCGNAAQLRFIPVFAPFLTSSQPDLGADASLCSQLAAAPVSLGFRASNSDP